MVFICLHTAITIPHITEITQQFTGTSGYGVALDASSSKNTTYNQSLTISQEQTMVLLWLHTAITIPINQTNNITGTYASGVYLAAYSSKNTTYKPKPYNITGTYGVDLYADSNNNINKPKPKITTTGTYNGVYLEAYSKLQQKNTKIFKKKVKS